MLLKRVYKQVGDELRCVGVELGHTGVNPEQNFSTRLVADAVAQRWMEIGKDTLTIKTDVGPLVYKVKRIPGFYSCHNGKRIPISDLANQERFRTGVGRMSAQEARAWLEANGQLGKPSPNKAWPAGYEVIDHYECVLDPAMHAKYKAKPGALAMSQRAAKL